MPGKIKVTCPNGHKLAAEERKAGKTVACPVCGVKLTIPVPEDRKCTDSAVLRILGIGDELLKASRGEKTKYDPRGAICFSAPTRAKNSGIPRSAPSATGKSTPVTPSVLIATSI